MKDYEKLAKTAFVNSKEYQQLAERLRNKNKKLIAASCSVNFFLNSDIKLFYQRLY